MRTGVSAYFLAHKPVPGPAHLAPSLEPLVQTSETKTSFSLHAIWSLPATTRSVGPSEVDTDAASPFGPTGPEGPWAPERPGHPLRRLGHQDPRAWRPAMPWAPCGPTGPWRPLRSLRPCRALGPFFGLSTARQ